VLAARPAAALMQGSLAHACCWRCTFRLQLLLCLCQAVAPSHLLSSPPSPALASRCRKSFQAGHFKGTVAGALIEVSPWQGAGCQLPCSAHFLVLCSCFEAAVPGIASSYHVKTKASSLHCYPLFAPFSVRLCQRPALPLVASAPLLQACGLPERYVPNMLLAVLWASQASRCCRAVL